MESKKCLKSVVRQSLSTFLDPHLWRRQNSGLTSVEDRGQVDQSKRDPLHHPPLQSEEAPRPRHHYIGTHSWLLGGWLYRGPQVALLMSVIQLTYYVKECLHKPLSCIISINELFAIFILFHFFQCLFNTLLQNAICKGLYTLLLRLFSLWIYWTKFLKFKKFLYVA